MAHRVETHITYKKIYKNVHSIKRAFINIHSQSYERHSCQCPLMVDVYLIKLSPGSVICLIRPFSEWSNLYEFECQIPQQSHEGCEPQSTEEPTGSSAPRLTQQYPKAVVIGYLQFTQTFFFELHPQWGCI